MCVCACVRACVRACVSVGERGVRACVGGWVVMYVNVRVRVRIARREGRKSV